MRNLTITIQDARNRAADIAKVIKDALDARSVVSTQDDSDVRRTGQIVITVFGDDER